jgi:Cu/Ag efflux pump CusA
VADDDDGGSGDGSDDRHETRAERIDRELVELLNELRVGLPGVQFLFAFLLTVPFQARGGNLRPFDRDVYVVTLVAAAVATVLLIAPAAQHRVLFRQHDKEGLLRRSSRSAYAGLLVLALAVPAAVLLVVDVLVNRTLAWSLASVIAAMLLWWWVAVPLVKRRTEDFDDPGGPRA